jgi:hypothetical protein
VAFVYHVFPDGVDASESFASFAAVEAYVADHDLFAEVGDESLEIDEILGVRDEE